MNCDALGNERESELRFIHLFPPENFGTINKYQVAEIHFTFHISYLVDPGSFHSDKLKMKC